MTETVILVSVDVSLEHIAAQLDAFLRPQQDDRQARKRERILAAASAQFIAHGYKKASIEDIARQAGVAKGTVYLYYRSKAELLFHAIAREKQQLLYRLAPLREPGLSPLDRLRGYIALGLILNHDMPLVTRLTGGDHEIELAMREVDADVLERINEQQTALTVRLVDEATEGALPRDELQRRARVLVELMYAVITAGTPVRRDMSFAEYAEALADLVVNGIVHPPPRLGRTAPFTPLPEEAG